MVKVHFKFTNKEHPIENFLLSVNLNLYGIIFCFSIIQLRYPDRYVPLNLPLGIVVLFFVVNFFRPEVRYFFKIIIIGNNLLT
jgi:hypothetical protein